MNIFPYICVFLKVLQQPLAGTWLYPEKREEEKEWSYRWSKGQAPDGYHGLQPSGAHVGPEDAEWTGWNVSLSTWGKGPSPLPGNWVGRPVCFQRGGGWPEERGNCEKEAAEQVGPESAAPERDRDFKSSTRAL